MTRCICCDWSPSVSSLGFMSYPTPQRLLRHGIDMFCDVCLTSIHSNLNSITKSSPDDVTKKEKKDEDV